MLILGCIKIISNMYVVCMECPTLQETSETLHEGEEYEIDNSGCCTVLKKRCNKEKCTPQDECLENLEKVPNPSTLNDCCPKFMCGKQ